MGGPNLLTRACTSGSGKWRKRVRGRCDYRRKAQTNKYNAAGFEDREQEAIGQETRAVFRS